jgi:predicted RNA binding protein YcfA (HicA-like mRNA interferase family)
MTRFPSLEGKEVIAVLKEHGFSVERQRGSHCYLKHEDGRATVVPVHAGEAIGHTPVAEYDRDFRRKI